MKKFVFIFAALMFVLSTLMVITYANNSGDEDDYTPPVYNGESTTLSTTSTTTTGLINLDELTTTTTTTTKKVVKQSSQSQSSTPSSSTTTVATPTTVKKYDVTFNTNGGSSVSKQTIEAGKKASKPTNPTKANYKFVDWYENESLTKAFNFNTAINKTYTLYAKWEAFEELNISRSYSTTLAVTSDTGVTVTITCNNCDDGKELTKLGLSDWNLSTNKKVLTKTFDENYNQEITVTDNEGKTEKIRITISNVYDNSRTLGTSISFPDMSNVKNTGNAYTGNVLKGTNLILLEVRPKSTLENSFINKAKIIYNGKEVKISSTSTNANPVIKIPISISASQTFKTIDLEINWGNGKVEYLEYTVKVTFVDEL